MQGKIKYKAEGSATLFTNKQKSLWVKSFVPKKMDEILGKSKKKKQFLSQRTKKFLLRSAIEAHKLDSSKSVTDYYQLFLQRLRASYANSQNKEVFFEKDILEKA